MVLGAQRRDVLLLVIAQGMKLVVVGVALGLLASLGLKRWMNTLLYDVRPTDPATFAVVALLLIAVALLAGENDKASSDAVKAVRKSVERARLCKVELFPSSLQGYKLLRLEPKVVPAIAGG